MDKASIVQYVNDLKNRNDQGEIQLEILNLVTQTDTQDDNLIFQFKLLLGALESPYDLAEEILLITDNVLIIETLLEAINYEIKSSLNDCIWKMQNYDMLEYILKHPYANFMIEYKRHKAVRISVLNIDLKRLSVMLNCRSFSVHVKDNTMLNLTPIEIAIRFDLDNVINLFLEHGIVCTHPMYNDDINDRVRVMLAERTNKRLSLFTSMLNSQITKGSPDQNDVVMYMMDEYRKLEILTKMSNLNHKLRRIAS